MGGFVGVERVGGGRGKGIGEGWGGKREKGWGGAGAKGLPFHCPPATMYAASPKMLPLFPKYGWPSSLTTSLVIEDKVVMLVYPQHCCVTEPTRVSGKDIFIAWK